jgi:hypothetical protein
MAMSDEPAKRKHPCTEKTWCSTLSERFSHDRRAGFHVLEVVDVEKLGATMETRVVGVYYKESAKDKGMMLNFCPFCGTKITWGFEK